MVFNIIALVIAVMIFAAGIYYLVKEKADAQSRKIYGIITAVGGVGTVIMIVKLVLDLING